MVEATEGRLCSICGRRASVKVTYSGLYMCPLHFNTYFESRVVSTIKVLRMVRPGEKVAVAVSGGKDSLSLLHLLAGKTKELDIKIVGILIDEGIRGYREAKLEAARVHAEKRNVELIVDSFKGIFGFTLDEAVQALLLDGFRYKPCTVCGVLRRYALNQVALDLGVDKLATAHNLDDEVQAFLINAIQSNLSVAAREGPLSDKVHEKLVPRIKPFYFIPEKEVMVYALLNGIESPFVECPYIVYSLRHVLRKWLNQTTSNKNPGLKHRIMFLKTKLTKHFTRQMEFKTCKICGMPSSRDTCKACEFKNYVTSLLKRDKLF